MRTPRRGWQQSSRGACGSARGRWGGERDGPHGGWPCRVEPGRGVGEGLRERQEGPFAGKRKQSQNPAGSQEVILAAAPRAALFLVCVLWPQAHVPLVLYPKKSQLGWGEPAVCNCCPGQAGVGIGRVLDPSAGNVAGLTDYTRDAQTLMGWEGEAEGPRTREGQGATW